MPAKVTSLAKRNITEKAFEQVKWPVQNVQAFTTTRKTPLSLSSANLIQSSSCFAEFNLGTHVGDAFENIHHNRNLLTNLLPEHTNIQWLEQVHGNQVHYATEYSSSPIEADAIITQSKNIALSIMTADCLPILIAAADGSEIAAIHGGWKPLANNIINKTLTKMNTPAEQLCAWLGPCISEKVFEVGGEVKRAFVEQNSDLETAFMPTQQTDKYLANLHFIAKSQLKNFDVPCINELQHCTYSMAEQYYSYRREQKTGRMATIICRI